MVEVRHGWSEGLRLCLAQSAREPLRSTLPSLTQRQHIFERSPQNTLSRLSNNLTFLLATHQLDRRVIALRSILEYIDHRSMRDEAMLVGAAFGY